MARLCSVPECGRPHKTRGYCTRHYQLWRRNGEAGVLNPKARFFPGVTLEEKMAMVTTVSDGCWLWNDLKSPGGYGVVSYKGHTEFAHRAAWRLANGPIPEGMIVDHIICNNPACVRVSHLALDTQSGHITRMYAEGRGANGSRHHMAKLTEAQATAILHSDASNATLAQEYGVSQSLVKQIRARKIWKHIE